PWGASARASGIAGSERHDDLAEDVALLHAPERAVDLLDRDLGVDHRLHRALAELFQRGGEVLDPAAEAADQPELLLVELEELDLGHADGGRAAGDERAAALEREEAASPGVDADMLEDDVDAALLRQLADDALEALLAIVDHVVGAERLRLLALLVAADGRDDGGADALGELD